MTIPRMALGALCLLAHLAGCAGNGEGLDANGRPLSPDGGGTGVVTPDLASIQANVFTPICAQCHVGANAPQGLRLDAANSYASLVGVPSSEQPSVLRVEPGDPDASYIVHKIEGRAAVGARMPLDQPPLPAATIQAIRQWITDGALPAASAGASATPFAVQTVSATSKTVAVALTHAVDAALVNDTTVKLDRSEDQTGALVPVAAHARVSPHNEALILVEPAQPLAWGRYRLTLRGTGAAALADWNATLLDGDLDGSPGGDSVTILTAGDAT
jgi:hypothetical protein